MELNTTIEQSSGWKRFPRKQKLFFCKNNKEEIKYYNCGKIGYIKRNY